MTTEEKAKAYDMALEAARKELGVDRKEWEVVQRVLRNIFPELRESEDERIRKGMIRFLESEQAEGMFTHEARLSWIAYLEKQKEHFRDDTKMVEQKPADDKAFEEWIDDWWKHSKINNPDSYDKGDEIQFDEKGFKNFCRGIRNMYANQESAEWSEEDELMRTVIIQTLERFGERGTTGMQIDWLKSLRPQHHKEIYQAAKRDLTIKFMNYLDENRPAGKMSLSNGECEDIDKAFKENDWAKIIRYIEKYKPHWKPSEEQMCALKRYSPVHHPDVHLVSLYDDLKKLM